MAKYIYYCTMAFQLTICNTCNSRQPNWITQAKKQNSNGFPLSGFNGNTGLILQLASEWRVCIPGDVSLVPTGLYADTGVHSSWFIHRIQTCSFYGVNIHLRIQESTEFYCSLACQFFATSVFLSLRGNITEGLHCPPDCLLNMQSRSITAEADEQV